MREEIALNYEKITCPECGEELGYRDEIFTRELSDTVAGCSLCLHRHNAAEWMVNDKDEWMAEEWILWDTP